MTRRIMQDPSVVNKTNESDENTTLPMTCRILRESMEIYLDDECNGKTSNEKENGDLGLLSYNKSGEVQEPIETDITNENSGNIFDMKENGDVGPASSDRSGEGLPYAPENFPLPGDKWGWKVGKRVAITGHYLDRYLYLPKRLRLSDRSSSKPGIFASKLAVERYIRTRFPDVDIGEFFASFSWKIPSNKSLANGIPKRHPFFKVNDEGNTEHSDSDSDSNPGALNCKAQNKMCSSLSEQLKDPTVAPMPCDKCCCEPGFCRHCCCILCWRTISSVNGGYDYIKCEALIDENKICGHLAHLECAVQAYMAGTVGGSIGLEAEYYCRCCDTKTALESHVTRLLEASKSIDSPDELEKTLKLGFQLLRGSQRASAKMLLELIKSASTKLKCGIPIKGIWTDNTSSGRVQQYLLDVSADISLDEFMSADFKAPSVKLNDEVDMILQSLKKSQEVEYKIAEEQLLHQKSYLQNLYQQLEQESSRLACKKLPVDFDELLSVVFKRNNQIKREVQKLKEMKEIAKGFGKTSKRILREHFGLNAEG